ncbi:hypothetical protein BD779DRAFT_1540794 [Infundibulicybe gibba]|nr:hypothetical protein BD779DRAFT_1540794 [Infundibulicybe gibba]
MVMKLLLDQGGIDINPVDSDGETPYDCAIRRNRWHIIELLRMAGGRTSRELRAESREDAGVEEGEDEGRTGDRDETEGEDRTEDDKKAREDKKDEEEYDKNVGDGREDPGEDRKVKDDREGEGDKDEKIGGEGEGSLGGATGMLR